MPILKVSFDLPLMLQASEFVIEDSKGKAVKYYKTNRKKGSVSFRGLKPDKYRMVIMYDETGRNDIKLLYEYNIVVPVPEHCQPN